MRQIVLTKDIISKLIAAGYRENLFGDYFFKPLHILTDEKFSRSRDRNAVISITKSGVVEVCGNDSDLMYKLEAELKEIIKENEI